MTFCVFPQEPVSDLLQAAEPCVDPLGRVRRRRQNLVNVEPSARLIEKNEIGERSTDVTAKPVSEIICHPGAYMT